MRLCFQTGGEGFSNVLTKAVWDWLFLFCDYHGCIYTLKVFVYVSYRDKERGSSTLAIRSEQLWPATMGKDKWYIPLLVSKVRLSFISCWDSARKDSHCGVWCSNQPAIGLNMFIYFYNSTVFFFFPPSPCVSLPTLSVIIFMGISTEFVRNVSDCVRWGTTLRGGDAALGKVRFKSSILCDFDVFFLGTAPLLCVILSNEKYQIMLNL